MFKVARAWLRRLVSASLFAYILIAGFLFVIFFWRLSGFTPGISSSERSDQATSAGLRAIYHSPLNAPHKLLEFLFIKLHPHSVLSLRLGSAFIAVAIVFCFYKLAVSWFGRIIGLFGTLIFISLPLFIVSAHQGYSVIMFFSPVILVWLFAWLLKTQRSKSLAWLTLLIACGLLLYTPGMLWWLAGSLIVCHKRLVQGLAAVPAWVSAVGGLLLLTLASPLIAYGARHPSIFKQLFLVQATWVGPLQLAKHVGWMFLALFIKTPYHSPLILGRVALVNVLALALIIFGVYAMQVAARPKALWLGLWVGFGVLAAGLNNSLALLALSLPPLVLFASAGLRYLYIEWRSIFPRNPVPKGLALVLIAAVVASQMYFGIRYALIAWPHASATRQTYMLK